VPHSFSFEESDLAAAVDVSLICGPEMRLTGLRSMSPHIRLWPCNWTAFWKGFGTRGWRYPRLSLSSLSNNGVAGYEVDCGDSKCSDGATSDPGSSEILLYLTSVPAKVVSISGGFTFSTSLPSFTRLAAFFSRKTQHIVPIARTTATMKTGIPISNEGGVAADEARVS